MTRNNAETRELGRELGLLALTALVVGEVIGVGIFMTPAGMATSLGSPMWLLVVWLVMGAMAVAGALVHGELAAIEVLPFLVRSCWSCSRWEARCRPSSVRRWSGSGFRRTAWPSI